MSSKRSDPTNSQTVRQSTSRSNQILIWLALLGIVLGALLGQAFITWVNATLL